MKMFKKNLKTLHNELSQEVNEKILAESISRAKSLSLIFAFLFLSYGITSKNYISQFDAKVDYWNNTWPRFIFCFIPFILQFIFINKSKISNHFKLIYWVVSFSFILHITSWIHVWPIAMNKDPHVLLFVNSANTFLFATMFSVIAPPNRYLLFFISSISIFFIFPLFYISYISGNNTVLIAIINDSCLAMFISTFLSINIHKLHTKIIKSELQKTQDAKKFLSPTVAKAIYENRKDLLETRNQSGFLLIMDIRGYTSFIKGDDSTKIYNFMDQYHELVAKTVSKLGGVINRNNGDGHIISFGFMDDLPHLDDIPGLENELSSAENRRFTTLCSKIVECAEVIITEAQKMASEYGFHNVFKIGAAIDFGEAEIKLIGDKSNRMEFDMYGSVLVRCTRLESHTKLLANQFNKKSSILILSEDAHLYLDKNSLYSEKFHVVDTTDNPIRDFPEAKIIYVQELDPIQLNYEITYELKKAA